MVCGWCILGSCDGVLGSGVWLGVDVIVVEFSLVSVV